MYVSISAYDDGDLLRECIHSVRESLPDAHIAVVDGKYETWPEGMDNSSDETAAIAEQYGDSYHPAGPFKRERNKHIHRVNLAPTGERALFLDADERILQVNQDALEKPTAYRPRIVNAKVYSSNPVSYWPRSFYPETVDSINRWDAYLFDVACERTDDITIVHRHDLRDRAYRENKVERFRNEGRKSRYESGDSDALDVYLNDEFDVTPVKDCPKCGEHSVVVTPATEEAAQMTFVEVCLHGMCYADVTPTAVDEWRYLPDDWQPALTDDPVRLRRELIDAGCEFVGPNPPELLPSMQSAIKLWIDEHL